jgi:hypothetical protein
MVTQRKQRTDPRRYIEELKNIVLTRYPGAEFEVTRIGPAEYDLAVFGDDDDMFEVLEDTSPRATAIRLDHDLFIHVLPLGRRISDS